MLSNLTLVIQQNILSNNHHPCLMQGKETFKHLQFEVVKEGDPF